VSWSKVLQLYFSAGSDRSGVARPARTDFKPHPPDRGNANNGSFLHELYSSVSLWIAWLTSLPGPRGLAGGDNGLPHSHEALLSAPAQALWLSGDGARSRTATSGSAGLEIDNQLASCFTSEHDKELPATVPTMRLYPSTRPSDAAHPHRVVCELLISSWMARCCSLPDAGLAPADAPHLTSGPANRQ